MGAEVEITWNDRVPSIVNEACAKGINDAAIYLQGKMRENFGRAAVGYQLDNVIGKQAYRYKRKGGEYVRNIDTAKSVKLNQRVVRQRFKSSRNKYASSAPGDFPAVRTGRLRNSIGVVRAKASELTAYVGTNQKHGRWLEQGYMGKARDGTRYAVAARPWCLRSLMEEREKLKALISKSAGEYITKRLGGKGGSQ